MKKFKRIAVSATLIICAAAALILFTYGLRMILTAGFDRFWMDGTSWEATAKASAAPSRALRGTVFVAVGTVLAIGTRLVSLRVPRD